jgi:hypothetical protein
MSRRPPYSRVEKSGQHRPEHVKGQGDVVYRRFECFNPICTATQRVIDADCGPGFSFECATCGYVLYDGGSEALFDYKLVEVDSGEEVAAGSFAPGHRDYLDQSERAKYCLNCYSLLPLKAFDRHGSRVSGRQGECRMCKRLYNDLKNWTRLPEQHREAADNRRMFRELSGETRLREPMAKLLERFGGRCFACGRALRATSGGEDGYYLDHTLPVSYLWPLDFGPTVLCRTCNGNKGDRWPSAYYDSDAKLRELSTLTGIPYATLTAEPKFNPEQLERLKADADDVITRWVRYPDRLLALRNRILERAGVDVFADASPQARAAIGLDGA